MSGRGYAHLSAADFAAEVGYGISLMTNARKNAIGPRERAWLWESYGDELVARLRAAPSPVTEPGTFERRWKSLAVWAAQETVGGARAMGERVLERMVAIERGDPDTLVPASWAAPSPVKAAGEGPTKAEIGLVAAALVSAHNASDAVLLAGYAERARMLLVALAAIRAPAPTSAVPGLREAVAECRSRFAAIRDSADKARKRDDTARYQGWVCALDWVLAEIDRRAAGEVTL